MTAILGVDPGMSGALALCRDGAWDVLDVPIVGHEINIPVLCGWLREQKPDHAIVEFASARPGQGVTSMFRFGCAYGEVKALIAAFEIPLTIVAPTRWKPMVGLPKGADKEASRLRALQLFPDQAAHLARKKDHGRADAMLLAHFGAMNLNSA
jgi:crossover junction endodeoxyribonuclease RuvC